MKEALKYLSFINVIGFSVASISLILFIWLNSIAWGKFFIAVNLMTSIPFVISGIVTLKNIEKPNERKIQNTLITVFLILWLPSIGLPFAYELRGLLISLGILALGLWGILKMKDPMNKMLFINNVGMFFLLLNSFVVFGSMIENI